MELSCDIDKIIELTQKYSQEKLKYTQKYSYLQKIEGKNISEKDNRLQKHKKTIEMIQHAITDMFHPSMKNDHSTIEKLAKMNNEYFNFSPDIRLAIEKKMQTQGLFTKFDRF